MMDNDNIERKMNFIVEQQAQFASDIQQLQAAQNRTEQVVSQTAEAVGHTVEAVGQVAEAVGRMGEVFIGFANVTQEGFNNVNAKLNALVDAQIRTEEHLLRIEGNVERTDMNLARTGENLRSLISVVDRHIREGRNGT
jgi:hypothetical protein